MTTKVKSKRRTKDSILPSPFYSVSLINSSLSRGICLLLIISLLTTNSKAASVQGSGSFSRNFLHKFGDASPPLGRINNQYHRLVDQHNEYNSGGSTLDDDTLRLSLAIDDDSSGATGLNVPSLRIFEPKVYLRVSGESGMIKPENEIEEKNDQSKATIYNGGRSFNPFRASLNAQQAKENEVLERTDLQTQSRRVPINEDESLEGENTEDDDEMNGSYHHHHFPYIESYREKYVRPEPRHFMTTTTESPSQTLSEPFSSSLRKVSTSHKQEWSDIIAQVTTPSSFNEINSSASEHRLADFHFRANLPSYFYNKYSPYSEEDLENVADLDDEHSKYFVKTKPRSVTTAGSNIYSNFYYEPPSFSTKSVPIPVKTNKEKVVFVSAKPTQADYPVVNNEQSIHHHAPLFSQHHQPNEEAVQDEVAQQDSTLMTTISTNFTNNFPTMTPPAMNYDKEEEGEANYQHFNNPNLPKDVIFKTSASAVFGAPTNNKDNHLYYKILQNLNSASNNNNYSYKSSAETLDVSTSQSIVSKVTVNNPHHHLQIVHTRPDFYSKTSASVLVTTPEHRSNQNYHTQDSDVDRMTSRIKLGSTSNNANNDVIVNVDDITTTTTSRSVTTAEEPPSLENEGSTISSSTPVSTHSTTTDATSIPGVPGVDYPTLGEIPQTGFDCQKQRYKGFFADIDTKCQAWHYCDFTDGHSSFLCPNGTLFSQVLLTCDWWFNVDCNQARQLYVLNERLYRYIKPPKPSFPEDFIGEHVDKWLLQQFTNGYLPKVRKKSKAKFVGPPPPPPPSQSKPEDKNLHDEEKKEN